jgi:hypothetical protein
MTDHICCRACNAGLHCLQHTYLDGKIVITGNITGCLGKTGQVQFADQARPAMASKSKIMDEAAKGHKCCAACTTTILGDVHCLQHKYEREKGQMILSNPACLGKVVKQAANVGLGLNQVCVILFLFSFPYNHFPLPIRQHIQNHSTWLISVISAGAQCMVTAYI